MLVHPSWRVAYCVDRLQLSLSVRPQQRGVVGLLRITSVWACALLLAACATEASPPALPSASLVGFTEMAERCVPRPPGRADSLAAVCACRALNGRVGSVAVR